MSSQVKRCPEVYEAQKMGFDEDLNSALPSILEKMEWGTNNELILDHGCGTGSTCHKYFVPYAEKSNSTIYALDNCEAMVKFGSENFPHPRVKYVCGTLTEEESPVKDLKFNKIFSIYIFQFIDDFRRELKGFYDALLPGGEVCLITNLYVQFFDLFKQLREHEKFGPLAKLHLNIPRWLGEPQDNVHIFKSAIIETGFEIKESFDRENSHVLPSPGVIADFVLSLNAFAKNLSPEEQDELREMYHTYFRETETKGYKPSGDSTNSEYTFQWDALYILLKKPE